MFMYGKRPTESFDRNQGYSSQPSVDFDQPYCAKDELMVSATDRCVPTSRPAGVLVSNQYAEGTFP